MVDTSEVHGEDMFYAHRLLDMVDQAKRDGKLELLVSPLLDSYQQQAAYELMRALLNRLGGGHVILTLKIEGV